MADAHVTMRCRTLVDPDGRITAAVAEVSNGQTFWYWVQECGHLAHMDPYIAEEDWARE